MMNSYIAAYFGVPTVFISGDEAVTECARRIVPSIETLAVNKGVGSSTISINPDLAIEEIENKVQTVLSGNISDKLIKLPDEFNVEINYFNPYEAYHYSFFPGVRLVDGRKICFRCENYYDVLVKFLYLL